MSSRSKKSEVDNLAYPAMITKMAGILIMILMPMMMTTAIMPMMMMTLMTTTRMTTRMMLMMMPTMMRIVKKCEAEHMKGSGGHLSAAGAFSLPAQTST